MHALWLAWRHGGHDPYCLYNSLGPDYRPVGGGDPRPPPHPWRLKMVLYAFAMEAQKELVDQVTVMAGGTVKRRLTG